MLGENRNAPARLRQPQQLHQNNRGWIDIAYHVGVDRTGNIYELGDPLLVGDTATEYDPTSHFLVLCEGDFDQETVTPEQLHRSAMAFAWAAQTFTVSSDTLAGHRDFASTACPAASLYAAVSTGEVRRRVDELLAVGPVNALDGRHRPSGSFLHLIKSCPLCQLRQQYLRQAHRYKLSGSLGQRYRYRSGPPNL